MFLFRGIMKLLTNLAFVVITVSVEVAANSSARETKGMDSRAREDMCRNRCIALLSPNDLLPVGMARVGGRHAHWYPTMRQAVINQIYKENNRSEVSQT